MGKVVNKWFAPGRSLNWHKDDFQKVRRQNALKSRKGDVLAAGKALLSLSNVTTDAETKSKAKADSTYFFIQYKKKQTLKAKSRRR